MSQDLDSPCISSNPCFTAGGLVCDINRKNSVCKIRHGYNCTTAGQSCVAGATCMGNPQPVCTCVTGVSTANDASGLCNAVIGKVTGNCENNTACAGVNAQCSIKICTCNSNLYETNYAIYTCRSMDRKVGGTCSASLVCEQSYTTCVNNTCKCNSGFTVDYTTLTCKSTSEAATIAASFLALVTLFMTSLLI